MTKTGTPEFNAPEIFTDQVYNEKVDVWSAGIMLYMLIVGHLPFESD
jgi:serine/threonine protein kinase